MEDILYQYKQIDRVTWIYLSSMMTIGIYFKFSRFWSVRNLDLLGLIALAPGLVMAAPDSELRSVGYIWLFAVGLFFLLRLLADPMMVRRPLLEPNLSPGGLTFMLASLFVFLMMNVITSDVTESDLEGARRLDQILAREQVREGDASLGRHGPGYPLLHVFASVPSKALANLGETLPEHQESLLLHKATARTMAILSHLGIVAGMVLIGARHFGSGTAGIAAAALYLLLPYTAQMVGRVDHALPAALLVWVIAMYRRPLAAGMLMGLAAGAVYYPIFLIPLWVGFYWQRGLFRFVLGVILTLSLLVGSLALTSTDLASFLVQAKQMLGWTSLSLENVDGFWNYFEPAYRIPVVAAFVVVSFSLALWPAQKNLGTLLSCSAAVMLGTQFWHAQGGGLYVAWYLPLVLLTVFRPNLEDRIALSVLGAGWLPRLRSAYSGVEKAA